MRLVHVTLLAGSLVAQSASVFAQGATKLHEEGRCAIRGHCGKKSFFGRELPCPDNGLAREPEDDTREKLVSLCGNDWKEGPVCCEDAQVRLFLFPSVAAVCLFPNSDSLVANLFCSLLTHKKDRRPIF